MTNLKNLGNPLYRNLDAHGTFCKVPKGKCPYLKIMNSRTLNLTSVTSSRVSALVWGAAGPSRLQWTPRAVPGGRQPKAQKPRSVFRHVSLCGIVLRVLDSYAGGRGSIPNRSEYKYLSRPNTFESILLEMSYWSH